MTPDEALGGGRALAHHPWYDPPAACAGGADLSADPRVLLVDGDAPRRGDRAAALRARGLQVHEAPDAVAALAELPRLDPDVLLLSLDSAAMDLEIMARGILSMRALGHLQVLAVGDARPLSGPAQGLVTVLPAATTPDDLAKESERLAGKSRKKRPAAP